jgi:hypothetical protein
MKKLLPQSSIGGRTGENMRVAGACMALSRTIVASKSLAYRWLPDNCPLGKGKENC